MNPNDMLVGSLWFDTEAQLLLIPLEKDISMCWYIDKSNVRHGKIFFETTDHLFWRIQRPERFEKIA